MNLTENREPIKNRVDWVYIFNEVFYEIKHKKRKGGG